MLDEKNETKDRDIANRVTRNHRYKNETQEEFLDQDQDSYDEPSMDDKESDTQDEVYLKYNVLTHSHKKQKIFTKRFIQKYIHYAKEMTPELTNKATDAISQEWTRLRKMDLES